MTGFSKLAGAYTRVVRRHTHLTQEAPSSPLSEAQEGDRCPRPHCGGLIGLRAVVTLDGCCVEVYCLACSRSALRRVLEPYVPIPVSGDLVVEARMAPDSEAHAPRESDDSVGIAFPRSAHDDGALRRVLTDESPLIAPLDSH